MGRVGDGVMGRWGDGEKILSQSPITSHQSPVTNHQSPITSHQSPITNHQSPMTNDSLAIYS
ncbi:MAG: hypothetical protein F6K62_08000 [Sphaerospermopsis sp. SIO1G2]|nr:hypothetical protein [Sphaerospermopsis sp. SIO1G2]